MVESGGLENRCARKGTVGSNPTSSASYTNSHPRGACRIPEGSNSLASASFSAKEKLADTKASVILRQAK